MLFPDWLLPFSSPDFCSAALGLREAPRTPGSARGAAGGDGVGDTPDPISNSEVKTHCADGTAGATRWESTALPAPSSEPPDPERIGGLCSFVPADPPTPESGELDPLPFGRSFGPRAPCRSHTPSAILHPGSSPLAPFSQTPM